MAKIYTDERVDLVDSQGVIQERSILRSEIHTFPHLYLQIVIAVLLNAEGEILVHQRSKNKSVNPGDVDVVCGAIMTGEDAIEAALREAEEETGLQPKSMAIVAQDLNVYNRYRYLLTGTVEGHPTADPNEAEWVRFMTVAELREKQISGELHFVKEFFDELEQVLEQDD